MTTPKRPPNVFIGSVKVDGERVVREACALAEGQRRAKGDKGTTEAKVAPAPTAAVAVPGAAAPLPGVPLATSAPGSANGG